MDSLFNPQTIAMIGATSDKGKIGYRIIDSLLKQGFDGELYLINPKGGRILGKYVHKSINEVPKGIDLVFLAIPTQHIIAAVKDCIDQKVKYLVVLTAGFREIGGEGYKHEEDLKKLLAKSSTRLVGPNCAGLCNSWSKFHGSIESFPKKGNISFVSQSGSLCSTFSSNMAARESGVAKYISIGNKIDINIADVVEYLGNDPQTECIALYLEDISDGRRFFEVALNVSRKKPIVVLKSGRTKEGARATKSHTGAMAGEDIVTDGIFRQMGIIRVGELTQLYDMVATIVRIGSLKGKNIGILSDAGGPGVLATDAAVRNGLLIKRPSNAAREELRSHLLGFASVENPIDMTFTREIGLYGKCMEILARDGMNSILVTIPSHFSVKDEIYSTLCETREKLDVPIFVAWLSADEVEQKRRDLWKAGIPAFISPEQAAFCMGKLAQYGYWLKNHKSISNDSKS